jgi:hypothetical protein
MKNGSLVRLLRESLKTPKVEVPLKRLVLVRLEVFWHHHLYEFFLIVDFKGISSWKPRDDSTGTVALGFVKKNMQLPRELYITGFIKHGYTVVFFFCVAFDAVKSCWYR